MKARLIDHHDEQTYALIFEKGEEVSSGLLEFARAHHMTAGHLTAIGGFSDVTLGFFDRQRKAYTRIPVQEQVEVLSLVGDIALEDGKPKIHAHAVVGRSDGSTRGGHLLEAHVWPTLEVIVSQSPAHLQRAVDPETGLALIQA